MTELVRRCNCNWTDGRCRLSNDLEGWGCRLLTCMPESIPRTEKDKARLFANVYRYAEKVGVLQCPYYDETTIDRTLKDTTQLSYMVHLGHPTQTELLSKNCTCDHTSV